MEELYSIKFTGDILKCHHVSCELSRAFGSAAKSYNELIKLRSLILARLVAK